MPGQQNPVAVDTLMGFCVMMSANTLSNEQTVVLNKNEFHGAN